LDVRDGSISNHASEVAAAAVAVGLIRREQEEN
jgi:hypothetical protein